MNTTLPIDMPANSPAAKRQLLIRDVGHFLSFGGGVGLLAAPGTMGTLVAVPLYYAGALTLPYIALVAVAVVLVLVGVPLCARTGKALQNHDDGGIVWDEIAAFFAVLTFIPSAWQWQASAFALFRLLDIFKPFPISWLDKNIVGGVGVMLDDLAAALITVGLIHAAVWLLPAIS